MIINLKDYNHIYSKKKKVEIKPGVTFITGCNGAGKSTFLQEVIETFKENNITYQFLDCNKEFHISNLDFLGDRFEIKTVVKQGICSEHEHYENMFSSWMRGCRYGDEYKGKEVGIFIDGLDSGGDVIFYKLHMGLFKLIEEDCRSRGIILYLLITCNNFYYLSSNCSSNSRTLFVPQFKELPHPLYKVTDYQMYIDDITDCAKVRGFEV